MLETVFSLQKCSNCGQGNPSSWNFIYYFFFFFTTVKTNKNYFIITFTSLFLSQKGAELYEVGPNLEKLLDDSIDRKLDYVAIKGIVKPLGEPLSSVNNQKLTGVIQKLSVKEHVVARTTTGFWSDFLIYLNLFYKFFLTFVRFSCLCIKSFRLNNSCL